MSVAKERAAQNDFLPIWVRHEHLARYQFAATFVAGKTVLDCACGDGTSSELFARSGAARVHAVDVAADAVESAARAHVHPNLAFQVGDATNLPFANRSIDVYVSLETIEHLPDDTPYLREAARMLKADGVFICSTPNRSITNPGTRLQAKPWNKFHVREYNAAEFRALLNTYFSSVELFGQNPKNGVIAACMQGLGRVLPFHGAVRLNQMFKLPRFAYDRLEHHRVVTASANTTFEYSVAVCRGPREAAASV